MPLMQGHTGHELFDQQNSCKLRLINGVVLHTTVAEIFQKFSFSAKILDSIFNYYRFLFRNEV